MKKLIRFLTVKEVKQIHKRSLELVPEESGTRDEGVLESAVNQPKWDHNYGECSLRRLAASYAFYLTKDHPFIGANKRTATAAALTFMKLNGEAPMLDKDALENLIWRVSSGEISKSDFTSEFLNLFPGDLFSKEEGLNF